MTVFDTRREAISKLDSTVKPYGTKGRHAHGHGHGHAHVHVVDMDMDMVMDMDMDMDMDMVMDMDMDMDMVLSVLRKSASSDTRQSGKAPLHSA